MSKPIVSVVMITYNHLDYLNDAINGIFKQKGSFIIELIIADDSSTDGSSDLIKRLLENSPKGMLINYTRHVKNKGMMKNFIWALNQCKGDFIAICEGDDYWIDESKLDKQVNFLLDNEDFALTYHPAMILKKNGGIVKDFITENNFCSEVSNQIDLAIFGNYIHTPTVVFRNYQIKIPKYFESLFVGDYFLYLLISEYGKIKRISKYSAVYRFQTGYFSSQDQEKRRNDFKRSLRVFYKNYNKFSIRFILFLRFNYSTIFKDNLIIKKSNIPTNLLKAINYISLYKIIKSFKFFIFRSEFNRVYGKRFPI